MKTDFSKAEEDKAHQDSKEDRLNAAQLKLSLPVNSDNSNLYNKYKNIKNGGNNNSFESSFKDG